jgi:5,6,7,8-tetrahydromethanopterin hydro-lyase
LRGGPALGGGAAGVADAVAAGTIDEAHAGGLVIIAAVWVDPNARDADLVFSNNREAMAGALALGRAGLPAAAEVITRRDEAWNPFYRPEARG